MILLLEKLLQSSKTGIELLLAIAGTVVQISAATAAETFAIILAQQLGIQIQDKYGPNDVFQIGAVSLQREYPFIFVLFVGKFRYQHHIQRKFHKSVEIRSAAVANAVDRGVQGSGHYQNTGGVPYHALSQHRLADGIGLSVLKVTQIDTDRKGYRCTRTIYDLAKSQKHTFPSSQSCLNIIMAFGSFVKHFFRIFPVIFAPTA